MEPGKQNSDHLYPQERNSCLGLTTNTQIAMTIGMQLHNAAVCCLSNHNLFPKHEFGIHQWFWRFHPKPVKKQLENPWFGGNYAIQLIRHTRMQHTTDAINHLRTRKTLWVSLFRRKTLKKDSDLSLGPPPWAEYRSDPRQLKWIDYLPT